MRFRVLIDGQPPGPAHGIDVDGQGDGTVTEQRLYQLIRRQGPVTEHTFEVAFLEPGVQAYAFTFWLVAWLGLSVALRVRSAKRAKMIPSCGDSALGSESTVWGSST